MDMEALKAWGADTDEGLSRCMGMEAFYLRLAESVKTEEHFAELFTALEEADAPRAFGAAHALKGVLGNLSLTPLYGPMSELCELLRGREDLALSEEEAQVCACLVAGIREAYDTYRAL